MKKNRVRIEICLLLVVLLLTSLAFGQTVYAASYEPYNVNQSETETAIPILTTVPNSNPRLYTDNVYLLAGGNSYELQVENAVSASYKLLAEVTEKPIVLLSNESAQSVTITPSAPGQTVLSVTAVGADGIQTALTCRITEIGRAHV